VQAKDTKMLSSTDSTAVYVPIPQETERIGKIVLDAAFRVHTNLGPGLLESVYEVCLAYEIRKAGVEVETQVVVPIIYDGVRLESSLRIDLLAGKCVVVEIKAVETLHPVHEAQLLTYLKLSGQRLGYLFNFNVSRLKHNFKRLVL
jgi:GxxExxY protein